MASPKQPRDIKAEWVVPIIAALILAIGGIIAAAIKSQQGTISSASTPIATITLIPTADPTPTPTATATQTSIPNILGSYSGNHTFSGSGEPHQSMSLTITQQNGQHFSGTCLLQREYQIENGSVNHAGNIQFIINAIRDEGGTTVVTFTGIAQKGGGWQGTFTDTVEDTGTWSVMKTS